MANIKLVDNAWNSIQDADSKKHVLEISARTESGKVVEVRVRHNDGEEIKAKVFVDGKSVLPMAIADFETRFNNCELEIKE